MKYYPGFDIQVNKNPLGFQSGEDVFGPIPELRTLDSIRRSLRNPDSKGSEVLYCISMDVGKKEDFKLMEERNLLFGVVTYASGTIGDEPVRSQGHIHAISPSCNASTCEVYEIFDGEAFIYMQESGQDDAGECYAIYAKVGDVIIVPPGWVHATINANIHQNMTFGAWCVRDYGFDYEDVKKHKGIAFFPVVKNDKIEWEMNKSYKKAHLTIKRAREYPEFEIEKGKPIYTQFQENPDKFLFVSKPQFIKNTWKI